MLLIYARHGNALRHKRRYGLSRRRARCYKLLLRLLRDQKLLFQLQFLLLKLRNLLCGMLNKNLMLLLITVGG